MRILIRHFFERFLDKESLSPQGEPEANFTQALGFLAVPGAFIVILLQPLLIRAWDLVMIRCFFISFSMIVMGFLVVFEWDALFPDRRDYQILTPLPIGLGTLFLAKAAAFAIFLAVFLLDVNFFSALMWPGIDSGKNIVASMGAHLVTVVLGGLFAAISMAAVQGVLVTVLPAAAFRRVSTALQTLLMGVLVMLLFLSPRLAGIFGTLVRERNSWVYAFPGYWFAGLYEHFRPAVKNSFLLHLGDVALSALAVSAGVFLLTYLPLYRRHARKALEEHHPDPAGPGRLRQAAPKWIDRAILKHPVQIAVFHFINQTITRSTKHRLFLATYAGCGGALAVATFGSGRLPLTLSFILISALRAAFNFPSELRANWAFQVNETGQVRDCLAAMRKWVLLCAIAPLLVVQAVMEVWLYPVGAAVFHVAFCGALSVLLMEVMFLGFRKVPFTCAYFPGKINLVALSVIYVFGFTMYSRTMAGLEAWMEGEPLAIAAFFAVFALSYLALARYRDFQVNSESGLHYEDDGDPAVRTLELSA